MLSRAGVIRIGFVILVSAWPQGVAGALTIRSWDDANQRGGDLFGSGLSRLEYGHLAAALTTNGHTVLPGISALTPANLAGVDVFFHGTSSHIITAAEGSALADFVSHGGCLIVEVNSEPSEQLAGNAVMSALGVGSPFTGALGGTNSPTDGRFQNVVTRTTVGSQGDLRGLSYGTSLACVVAPGSGTIVGRVSGGLVTMVEYSAPGHILAVGDPYGLNLFQNPPEFLYNLNNEKAYINFIGGCGAVVPVKSSTWGALKAIYR